jgi:uncharacterized membrane protein YdbT with pleckstrin-like domain
MGKKPNPRVIIYWMRKPFLVALAFALVIYLIIFIDSQLGLWGGAISKFSGEGDTLIFAASLVVIFPMLAWNALKYATTTYELSERQFSFSKGVFSRKKFVAAYENIQNINVDRNLFEIVLGISTVRIETAGSSPGESEMELEGLSSREAEAIVREINDLSEKSKGKMGKLPDTGKGASPEELKEYSRRILAEIREIKDILSAEKRKKDWIEKKD